ncbi:hypothetical protein D3C77_662770 [compost metagenome]
MVLLWRNAGKAQQGWQALGETLKAVVAAGLDTQGAGPVELLGLAVIQGLVGGLQPDLIAAAIGRRRNFELGQGLHVIQGQFPGLTGVMVLLGTQKTVETLVRIDRRVDQQRLEPMAFGQMGGIVAAERAADQ